MLSVPILLKFNNESGKPLIEKTHTVVINRAGAKVLTGQPVTLGMRLEVAIPHMKRGSWATVVWLGDQIEGKQEVGIALDQTGDLWGVQFPDEIQQLTTSDLDPSPELAEIGIPELAALPASGSQTPQPALETDLSSADMLSGILRDLARKAIEECLGNALQEMKQHSDIMRQTQEDIATQAEERLRRAVESAVEQLETRSVELTERHRQACEQSLRAIEAAAEEHLKAQATEYDARLATSAKKTRNELARALADIGDGLGRD